MEQKKRYLWRCVLLTTNGGTKVTATVASDRAAIFAQDLGNPRNLAVAPNGTVYVTRREQGDVIALTDTNKDGRANQKRTVASGLKFVNDITINQNRLYFVTDTHLYATNLLSNGREGKIQTLISNLPDAGHA